MTTFLLIRHGETDAVGKRLTGWQPDCHLNRTGRAQARRLARILEQFPITAVYSSPLERAMETAGPIANAHRLELSLSDELGEFRFGEWEGASLEDLADQPLWRRFNQFRGMTRAPGGELMSEVQTRMVSQLDYLHRRHPNQMVAVISHCDPLRAALAHFLGTTLDMALQFEISPASVSIVEYGASSRVLCLNHRAHLSIESS